MSRALFRWLVSALAALLVLGLAACGQEEEERPQPGASPAASPIRGTISLGLIDMFSSATQQFIANSIRTGFEIAIEEANAAGGVAGYRIEVVTGDMGESVDRAVAEAQRLVNERGIRLITIGIHSGAAVALAELAKNRQDFLVNGAFATTRRLTGESGSRWSARANISTVEIGGTMAQFLRDKGQIRTVAIIAPDYEYGRHFAEDFKAQLSRARPDVRVVREEFPPLGARDMTPHVAAVQAARPDLVVVGVFGGDLINFLRAARDLGLIPGTQLFIHGLDLVKMETLRDVLPDGIWGTAWYPFWAINTPASQEFLNKYRAKTNDIPVAGSLTGYYAGKMLIEAIRKAGSGDLAAVLSALDSGVEFDGPVGRISVRGCDHMALGPFFVGEVRRGSEYPGGIGLANVVPIQVNQVARSCEEIARVRGG
jgi:branched-chain amino acid transport system substrate-binding protein